MRSANLVQIAIIITAVILGGCEVQSEKSYRYYVENPGELEYDYNYCKLHPSKAVCHDIVKKYIQYQNATHAMSGQSSKSRAFFDIDTPTDCNNDIDKPL